MDNIKVSEQEILEFQCDCFSDSGLAISRDKVIEILKRVKKQELDSLKVQDTQNNRENSDE